jgi:sigma-E factor negative regulatory protein RseA
MADGEAGPEVQEHGLALWAGDAQARARWRDYQLIGDVLRSQELARDGAHDAEFLSSLRSRLAREPVLLRPAAPVHRGRRGWAAPMAAMAGVAAVAGVVVMLRTSAPQAVERSALAAGGAPLPVAAAAPDASTPSPQVVNGRLIRDARLERYFAAHRQSANGAALQMPGAVVRSVDTIVLEDR